MGIEQKTKERIDKAIKSNKLDSIIMLCYSDIINADDPQMLEKEIGCLARGKDDKLRFDGMSSHIGNIYSIRTTYEKLLDLVERDDLSYFGK